MTPAFKRERLITLAQLVAGTRNKVMAEAKSGETNWGLGCRAHERLAHTLARASECGQQPWLTVSREGLYLMPLIDGVPVRPYRGVANKPGSRHLDALRTEASRAQPKQTAFSFMDADGPWFWLLALETDVRGMVVRAVYFQANEMGDTRHAWECPLARTPSPTASLLLTAQASAAASPSRDEARPTQLPTRPLTAARTLLRAHRALGLVELLVPKRIANEELGDAMELIVRMVEQQRHPWLVYIKVATTIFWVLLHAVRGSGCAPVKGIVRKKG